MVCRHVSYFHILKNDDLCCHPAVIPVSLCKKCVKWLLWLYSFIYELSIGINMSNFV